MSGGNWSNYVAVAVLTCATTYFAPHYFQKEYGGSELVAKRDGVSIFEIEHRGRRYLFSTKGGLVGEDADESPSREGVPVVTDAPESVSSVPAPSATPPAQEEPAPECLSSGGDPKAAKEAAKAAQIKAPEKNRAIPVRSAVPVIQSEADWLPLFPRPDLAKTNTRDIDGQTAPLPKP